MSTADTDYAVPPAAFLEEWLDEEGISQAELARRMGVSPKHVSKLLGGVPLTADVATKLSLVTNIPARVWLGYESAYRADLTRLALIDDLAAARDIVARFPLAELRKQGFVTATLREPGLVALQLLTFFGVGSLNSLNRFVSNASVAFRQGVSKPAKPEAVAGWLRIAELTAKASRTSMPAFDRDALRAVVPELRALSASPPEHFGKLLVQRLAAVGVQLQYVPEIAGCRTYGATRWDNDIPVVTLSLRYVNDGQFWFTLLHELGHLLLHSQDGVFIHGVDSVASSAEIEADGWAGDLLIPPALAPELTQIRSLNDAVSFAAQLGVVPGVVVGRLHHDGLWDFKNGQGLMKRLRVAE